MLTSELRPSQHQLAKKARDRTPEGWGELLVQLVVAITAGRTPSERERELFFDIARILLTQAERGARISFADRIAHMPETPTDLLLTMARDDVEVAAPILKHADGLSETILLELAETLSIPHLAEFAVREHLTRPITDILVRRGDNVVLQRLSLNGTSVLSLPSITYMISKALEDDELCRVLATRKDLPPDQSDILIQRMAALLRERITRREPAPPPPTTELEPTPADDGKPSPTRLKVPKRADVNELIRAVRDGTVVLDDVISQLSDEDRTNDIAVAFARLCELDEVAIMKVLVRKDANGISMVARALDLRLDTWRSLVEFRKRRLKLSDAEVRYEIGDYKIRSVAECRRTLAQFQARRARA